MLYERFEMFSLYLYFLLYELGALILHNKLHQYHYDSWIPLVFSSNDAVVCKREEGNKACSVFFSAFVSRR